MHEAVASPTPSIHAAGISAPAPRRRDLVLLVIGGALPVASGRLVLALTPLPLHESINVPSQVGVSVEAAVWIGALLLSYRRAPKQPFWKLILAFLWTDQIWLLGYIPTSLTWTLGEAFSAVHDAVSAHLLIAYPTGWLVGRFDRRLVGFVYVFVLATSLIGHAVWQPEWVGVDCVGFCPNNLLLISRNDTLERLVDLGSTAFIPFLAVGVIAAVVRHWRAATPAARRVLWPVLIATPLVATLTTLWYLALDFGWLVVTDVLAGQLLLFVDFIIPTGVIAGMLRSSLHRSSVADLAVELGGGVPIGSLRASLARTLRDPTLEIAFPSVAGGGLVDPAGHPFSLPSPGTGRVVARLEREGELLGVLVHDAVISDEDPGLVEAVTSVARLALENERLAAQVRAQLEEVRASRQRIVEAGDAERRRVERDLHDGAQQRLVALAMRLEQARGASADAQDLIDATTTELGAAIAEVRQLARGLHPPILTEAGLRAAVESLAERTPIPVEVEGSGERHAATVEATAYFVVAEALTNIARHANASHATVSIRTSGDDLAVEIRDDGRGGADPAGGSGLSGLRDRVAAIGGSLVVHSPEGGGTSVLATIPLAADGG
ncbi:MAG: hypothetical protein A2V84_06075 [Chloroflexi bacterium RBG_16_70_13]|nr:MAG: hypothetical protein A2V84_06075 [Chloroflexi bacterium RBG_16_70_13]